MHTVRWWPFGSRRQANRRRKAQTGVSPKSSHSNTPFAWRSRAKEIATVTYTQWTRRQRWRFRCCYCTRPRSVSHLLYSFILNLLLTAVLCRNIFCEWGNLLVRVGQDSRWKKYARGLKISILLVERVFSEIFQFFLPPFPPDPFAVYNPHTAPQASRQ